MLTVVYTVIYSYLVIYTVIYLLYILYIIIETLFTPPSLLCWLSSKLRCTEWIARHISLVSCYRIDYTCDTLSLLLDTAMQLYRYAAVYMLLDILWSITDTLLIYNTIHIIIVVLLYVVPCFWYYFWYYIT